MSTKQHTRRTIPRPKMGSKEYFLWCDESGRKGRHFSNFYGGVLVGSDDLKFVHNCLTTVCKSLRLNDEIKWNRVSAAYLGKYMAAMDAFFDLVKQDKIKVRIMFTKNGTHSLHGTDRLTTDRFFMLYYHFIKQAFGFGFVEHKEDTFLRIHFDSLPDTLAKRNAFKEQVKGLQANPVFQKARLKIRKQDLAEVDSKKHLLLQMMDVVLGSMFFRLNDKHKAIPQTQSKRSNRTIAKEKLCRHIIAKIRVIKPGFLIGVNTGVEIKEDYWYQAYRHLVYTPDKEIARLPALIS